MKEPLTAIEFKTLRIRNFTNQKTCAAWLDFDASTLRRWEAGLTTVPWTVATLMRLLDDGTITKELEG